MKTSWKTFICTAALAICAALQAATVTWTGASTTDATAWAEGDNWDTQSVPASGDEVVFPASETAVTINIAEQVSPSKVTVNGGDYTFTGAAIACGSSGAFNVDAGTVTLNNAVPDTIYTIASGATLVLKKNFKSPTTWRQNFKGSGNLVLDNMSFEMSSNNAYDAAISGFSGHLRLQNATLTGTGNSSARSITGSGTLTLAGGTITGKHNDNKIGNTAVSVVAGTKTTINGNIAALDLSKFTVVKESGTTLDGSEDYTVIETTKSYTGTMSVSSELAADNWTVRVEESSGTTSFILYQTRGDVTWNGGNGEWSGATAWTVNGSAGAFAENDTVFFPATDEGVTNTITVTGTVKPGSVVVRGNYVFTGTGTIDISSITVESGSFGFGSPSVYAGALSVASGASVVVDVGEGNAITVGSLTEASTDNYTYINSGTATFSNYPRHHVRIATDAAVVVNQSLSSGSTWFQWFTGSGTLIVDGATLDYSTNGNYGSMVSAFSGDITAKNGAAFSITSNGSQQNQLGHGVFTFAGATVTRSSNNSTINNTAYKIVAGTSNTMAGLGLDLSKTTIVAGDDELDKKHEGGYTVLTANTALANTGSLTLADDLKSDWTASVVETDSDEDGTVDTYSIVLTAKPTGFIITIAGNRVDLSEDAGLTAWLDASSYTPTEENELATANANGISPLAAYLLGYASYNAESAAPAMTAAVSGNSFTLAYDLTGETRTVDGIELSYAIESSDNIAFTDAASHSGATLAFASAGLYNKLVASIAATE